MPQIAGGCLCGKVRYSASGDPVFVGVCHCTDCQTGTGNYGIPFMEKYFVDNRIPLPSRYV